MFLIFFFLKKPKINVSKIRWGNTENMRKILGK